jgi:hypothetical protein
VRRERLWFEGRELQEARSLAFYHVPSRGTLTLVGSLAAVGAGFVCDTKSSGVHYSG